MPPWVARQWHVWRCSRSVSKTICFRASTDVRFYAQNAVQDGKKLQLSTVNRAIIVPSSVVNTRPEDVISHIKSVYKQHLTRDRFAVFLVTPSFARWLLNDETFLLKALRRAYTHMFKDWYPYARIHALCAVVDKLPVAKPIFDVESIRKEALERTEQPPVQETGQEGIAYATLRFSDSLPTSTGGLQDKAAISFVASGGTDGNGVHFEDIIRLPLANTVFQTGSPTTMTCTTWEKAKGASDFTLRAKKDVSHHGIRIQQSDHSGQHISALSVPLVPLSMPRQVEASMGNILRRVIGADGTSVTASQELENIVPRFFNSRGEPSQATTVWALVTSPENTGSVQSRTRSLLESAQPNKEADVPEDKMWEDFWNQDPPHWNNLVPLALASGARLHRVLSGGGGWGKKAGLLSLDPVPALEADSSNEQDEFDMFDGPEDLSSALQQVAHDGDYVQFFISPSTAAKEDVIPQKVQSISARWGLELGTIPSTSDSMPIVPEQVDPSKPSEISVFRHAFGALAEGGMVISRTFKINPEDAFSTVGASTIDVPFSRFSAVGWTTGSGEREGEVEEDSLNHCLESKPLPYHRDLFNSVYGEEAVPFLGLPGIAGYRGRSQDELADAVPANSGESVRHEPPLEKAILDRPPKTPIRYYTLQRDELAFCIDGVRRVDRKLARITLEFRELMHQIRKQNHLRMEAALRESKSLRRFISWSEKKMTDSYDEVVDLTERCRTLMLRILKRGRRRGLNRSKPKPLPRSFAVSMEEKVAKSYDVVADLTQEYRTLMLAIRKQNSMPPPVAVRRIKTNVPQDFKRLALTGQRPIDTAELSRRVDDLAFNISILHRLATDALVRMDPVAHFARAGNESAAHVYKLHMELRWALGAMILLARSRFLKTAPPQTLLSLGFFAYLASLTTHLLSLRAFRTNLFVSRDLAPASIQSHLLRTERAHPVAGKLRLSRRVVLLATQRSKSSGRRAKEASGGVRRVEGERRRGIIKPVGVDPRVKVRKTEVGWKGVREVRRMDGQRNAALELERMAREWLEG